MSLAQDIESRIQILDIVNRYVSTKKAGVNYKGLCPFHSEKSPSFVISPSKNIAHCFSCGKGGGPIKFLMEIEKIDFREAAGILAKEAGIELKTNYAREKVEKGEDVYLLYRLATEWYHRAIFLDENKKYLDYLLDRQISLETIKKFQLGVSHSPRDLLYFLKENGFATQFIIDSGLFVSENRDKFFGRIIFPIANTMGHTVAFTGRVVGEGMPKYLNSPASHIFDKSSILYGLHLAKQAIAKGGEVYIVEGQMDTIALHQAGVENTVGISGTALTKEHIRILKRFVNTIYLALDSDNAGVKATFSSIENLLNEDIEIKIIQIPNGKDPDEYTKSGGDFGSLRESALSVIEFYLREGYREYDIESIIGKKKLIEKCLEIIIKIKSSIEVDFYLQQIAQNLSISRDILYSEYKKSQSKIHRKGTQSASQDAQGKNTEIPVFKPSLTDTLAGYIHRYGFLDLFFREFRYTKADLTGTTLLAKLLFGTPDPDDNEMLRILDLHLEEKHLDANPELVERAFRDLLRSLHSELLENEKQKLLEGILPENPRYLEIFSEIRAKEKTLGLRR